MPQLPLVLLPNQLFGKTHLFKNSTHTYLIEEPIFFYDPVYHPYRPNKIKIAYMRACMRYYFDHCLRGPKTYIEYQDLISRPHLLPRDFIAFDPTDHNIRRKWRDLKLRVTFIDSPNFLFTPEQLQEYHTLHPGATRHASFYTWAKRRLAIKELAGVANLDRMNRQPPTSELAGVPDPKPMIGRKTRPYYEEAIAYASQRVFAKHLGAPALDDLAIYPITSADAYARFTKTFITRHLHAFGPFQDAVVAQKLTLHHSFMSAALNIGLMDPKSILRLTLPSAPHVPMNSFEGFLRQLIGFREYYRYLYVFRGEELMRAAAKDQKHRTPLSKVPALYTGKTGVTPFDVEFAKALRYGYAHHIVRLMIFLNFLLLNHINAEGIYRWFTEIVSIDAYPWVMVANIYAMGYFYKGASSRRYLSSSNYIKKMTDYKSGPWCQTWDDLYRSY
jgi:deoxyribodipyrimidine photolyase-related protein